MKTPVLWAVVIALLYLAVTLFITINLLHDSYNTNAFDLGIFTQDLKNTLHGQILYSTAGQYQLAHHFSPVLFLMVPLYWLFPHPQMLLVVQGVLLAFGGYLIYILAREYNYSHRAGLILEGLYFINPLVWGVALFDFHEVAFAIPALLVMFFGLKKKNWLFFSLGLVFALVTKEDVVIVLGVFGFVLMIADWWQRKKVSKIAVIIFCSAVLTYGIGIIVSHLFSNGESTRILSYFTNRYTYIGQPLSVAFPMAIHTIFSRDSLFLIGAYLAPLFFLPLFSPKWVIPAVVILLSGIFSTDYGQHGELMQYAAAAVPFLFLAFMEVLPKVLGNLQIQTIISKSKNRLLVYSLVFMVFISIGIILNGRIQLASFPNGNDATFNQVVALIPDGVTVTASNVIFPHLCTRTETYLDANEGNAIAPETGIISGDWGFPDKDTDYVVICYKNNAWYEAEMISIKKTKKYKLIRDFDGIALYQLNS